jgi:hypothetical protein
LRLAYSVTAKKRTLTFSDAKFVDQNGNERELTYWLHDYGRLAYWLKKYGKVDGSPLWESLLNIFALEGIFEGRPKPVREKWYLWHIGKLAEIDATRKIGSGIYRLGNFGELAFEAAKKSANWSESMENIVIAYLISKRMENLGIFLHTLSRKPIEVVCRKYPKDIGRPKDFQISWSDLSTCLRNAYLIQVESPNTMQELKASNNPVILSSFLLNEIYSVIANLRNKIVERLVAVGDTVNPYILTDRGSYEIKRALERLGILQTKYGFWFTNLPDTILSSFIWYALAKTRKKSISPNEFTKILKDDFRFLVDPTAVTAFLTDYVEYKSLGIDLNLLHNNLEENYSTLLERLVSLGFATVRPDGEVRIGAD